MKTTYERLRENPYPTETSKKLEILEAELKDAWKNNTPILPERVTLLKELVTLRMKELAQRHGELLVDKTSRQSVMQTKTRYFMDRLNAVLTDERIKQAPDSMEIIHRELERYNEAAVSWVRQSITWEDSEAYSLAAGILIKANEIC